MGRVSILAKIAANILTGGRRTTAVNTRDVLNEMADNYVSAIYNTAANFTSTNPILETKQIGVETDALTTAPKFKIGDGSTAWNSLPYASSGGGGSQTLAQVLAVDNKTGEQTIKSNDGKSTSEIINGSATTKYADGLVNSSSEHTSTTTKVRFTNGTNDCNVDLSGAAAVLSYTDADILAFCEADPVQAIMLFYSAIANGYVKVTETGIQAAHTEGVFTFNGNQVAVKPTEYPFTVSGTTVTLADSNPNVWGCYLNGVRCEIGGSGPSDITSISGTTVTFNEDQTGNRFIIIY